MAKATLRVARAGPLVTLQDGGRSGHLRFGVPASGAMDRKALAIANLALGNPPGQTAIEISLGGLVLECLNGNMTLALAGGGFIAGTGQETFGSWQVFDLSAGETLTIQRGPWGSWTYLALTGLIAAPDWLGSHSTHALSGFGGGPLASDRLINVEDTAISPDRIGAIPCPVWARPRHSLHAILGPQDRFFPAETIRAFASEQFHVSPAQDRMGARLLGPALVPDAALSIPSEPILRGSVQVSGDGTATVLLADHQTTGGYPKIATLLADDLDGFVQLRPNDPVRFIPITPDQALSLARMRARAFDSYAASLSRQFASA